MIAMIVVYIIDLSGIVESVKDALGKWIGVKVGRLKPIDCSLCMVWWVCLVYIIATGEFTLPMVLACAVLSFLSGIIKEVMQLVRELLTKGIDMVYKMIER